MIPPVNFSFRRPALLCALICLLATLAGAQDKPVTKEPEWKALFDGKTLTGWKVPNFAGVGTVEVKDGELLIGSGDTLNGVTFTNPVPKTNYEIEFEGKKIQGSDFFCAVTFPAAKTNCTFVLGGWGGAVVGISSIDQSDASENETTKYMKFENNKWYKIRIKVTPEKIEAWVDADKAVDLELKGKAISMRPGDIELNMPLGIATYQTSSAFKSIKIRTLGKAEAATKPVLKNVDASLQGVSGK
jgi:hypothetical protein